MLAVLLAAALLQQPSSVWVGVGYAPDEKGLRVVSLPYGSPAEKAGVMIDDVLVGFNEASLRNSVAQYKAGDKITLHILRRDEPVDIHVVIEERPVGLGAVKEYSDAADLGKLFPGVNWPEEQFANALIDEFKIGDGYKDLRSRLARLSDRGDPFRMSRVAYIQDDPFQLRTVAGGTFDQIAAATSRRNPAAAVRLAAEWLDAAGNDPAPSPLKTGLTLDQHLDQLVKLFQDVQATEDQAFAKLSPEERRFVESNCDELFALFALALDFDNDRDNARRQRLTRVMELAARVDFRKLFEGSALYWRVAQDAYLDDLESAVTKAWEAAGKPEGIFINRDSPIGKIIVGGSGNTAYRDDADILLDLGGKDFYANNSGSPRGDKTTALLIDFGGDDAYEATANWTQGAARMGHALLIDRKGDDRYLGREWAQGAAVLGSALFLDESGNDAYRGDQYAQGVAAWGVALHIDYDGDDTYDAGLLSQGVAMPGGAGWLVNGRGNDAYYAKGKHPTEYGDAGIFDSWSQGSGIGFRGFQSGGVAILYDGDGKDRYEAGNFSQGGGYYFGVGLLRDAGREDDVYIGSRYNQGFAAHQSIGYFEEMGGNDYYTTRQFVAQGLSWDETVVAFIDHAGDDVYEGGDGFSQGASAHNGFCLFLDLGGRNRFVYGTVQGSAGPNDYHGGASFSLFIAAGRGNTYNSPMKPDSVRLNGEYGFFADLPKGIPFK